MKKFEDLNEAEKKVIANLIDGIMIKNKLTNIVEIENIESLDSEATLKEILSEIKLLNADKIAEENDEEKVCACGVCL